jgi:hypothetical protein
MAHKDMVEYSGKMGKKIIISFIYFFDPIRVKICNSIEMLLSVLWVSLRLRSNPHDIVYDTDSKTGSNC